MKFHKKPCLKRLVSRCIKFEAHIALNLWLPLTQARLHWVYVTDKKTWLLNECLGHSKRVFFKNASGWRTEVIDYLYVTLLQIKKRVFYHDFQVDINWQKDAQIPNGVYEVRDMWQHENLGIIESTDSLWSLGTIGYHDNRAFRLKVVPKNSIKNNFLP